MEDSPWDNILRLCDEAERLIDDGAPVADQARAARIAFLCAQMTGRSSYINEKAGNLTSRAKQYFTARAHANYVHGTDGLLQDMKSLLGRIREDAQVNRRGGR
jgi:hypothetical protein